MKNEYLSNCEIKFPHIQYNLQTVTNIGHTITFRINDSSYYEGVVTGLTLNVVFVYCKSLNKYCTVKWCNVIENKDV